MDDIKPGMIARVKPGLEWVALWFDETNGTTSLKHHSAELAVLEGENIFVLGEPEIRSVISHKRQEDTFVYVHTPRGRYYIPIRHLVPAAHAKK